MERVTPKAVNLAGYELPSYLINKINLNFKLDPERTIVESELEIEPSLVNLRQELPQLRLDGEEIELIEILLNDVALEANEFDVNDESLVIFEVPPEKFILKIVTVCNPEANTALSGLYRSNGNYCTQCEAHGFRRITYYLDRPDILSIFTVRVEADKKKNPVLLANGNLIDSGSVTGTNKHYAVWNDPFPKPCYLFALVAGDLAMTEDSFITQSGRNITLRIYSEHSKESRCFYAMDALKRAMRWDEEKYSREYDLDIFMIVAVSDFNMGAMENKGLNIFNDACVLADPKIATDTDYAAIEAVIAHEYFHNWTGNRITCRDWFQLCLKEGLTVFRDQEFSCDMRVREVERINDVRRLRSFQFTEDSGALAHPVRPETYIEINNFYTATVYEKGAELVRMLRNILGSEAFSQGMQLYFSRHDGKAAIVEDFISCMSEVSGRNLDQFMRWYSQAGTPELVAVGNYISSENIFELTVTQICRPTPGQEIKKNFHIPLKIGLIDSHGNDIPLELEGEGAIENGIVELARREHIFRFINVKEQPYISLNRNFTAPVKLNTKLSNSDLLFLVVNDNDLFNRWESLQCYALNHLAELNSNVMLGKSLRIDSAFTRTLKTCLQDGNIADDFKALLLEIPGELDIAGHIGRNIDPNAIHIAREYLRRNLASNLYDDLYKICDGYFKDHEYNPDAHSAGRRALQARALRLLVSSGDNEAIELAYKAFCNSNNMTDIMASLHAINQVDCDLREQALADFYNRYCGEDLVLCKWFNLQATAVFPNIISTLRGLTNHERFSFTNPNKIRALIGVFANSNMLRFNDIDGSGYEFIAEMIVKIDAINPQIAARLATSFKNWSTMELKRRNLAKQILEDKILKKRISKDLFEITSKICHV